jgi:hypothetical protein
MGPVGKFRWYHGLAALSAWRDAKKRGGGRLAVRDELDSSKKLSVAEFSERLNAGGA